MITKSQSQSKCKKTGNEEYLKLIPWTKTAATSRRIVFGNMVEFSNGLLSLLQKTYIKIKVS